MNIKKKISMILTLLMIITTVLPSNIAKAENHLSTDKVIWFEGQPYTRPSGSCEIAGDGGSVVFGGYTSLKEVDKYWNTKILVAYSDNWQGKGKEFVDPRYGQNYGETNLKAGFPERKVTIGELTNYMRHDKKWLMKNVVIIPTLNVIQNDVIKYKDGKVEY